jgi:hypothetical protein
LLSSGFSFLNSADLETAEDFSSPPREFSRLLAVRRRSPVDFLLGSLSFFFFDAFVGVTGGDVGDVIGPESAGVVIGGGKGTS